MEYLENCIKEFIKNVITNASRKAIKRAKSKISVADIIRVVKNNKKMLYRCSKIHHMGGEIRKAVKQSKKSEIPGKNPDKISKKHQDLE